MWYTRIWVVLLAAAATAILGVALVVPRPAARELAGTHRRSLDRIQHNAELLLKLETRGWIDTVTNFSNDGGMVRLLEQATDRARDVSTLNARLSSRMLSLLGRIKAEDRPELAIAVDYQGKQICRIGPGEKTYKPGIDGLAGYPVIESALRGFQLDDSWSIDNKLYLVAAAPVISRTQSRYVGALLLGQRVDTVFANRLKARLAGKETHVAFFLRGATVATTLSSKALDKLPLRYEKLRDQVTKHGRSAAIRVKDGAKVRMVVMAAIPGEAAAHDAFYTVLGPPPSATAGIGAALDRVDSDKDMGDFPWVMLIGIFVVVAAIGVGLNFFEIARPITQMITQIRRVNQGDATRLDPDQHPGGLGLVAQTINDLIDRQSRRGGGAASKDLNKILGGPEDAATHPDLRMGEMPPLADAMPPLASDDQPATPLGALGGGDDYPAPGLVDTVADDALPMPVPAGGPPPGMPTLDDPGIKPLGGLDAEDAPTALDPRGPPPGLDAGPGSDLPLNPLSIGGLPSAAGDGELLGPAPGLGTSSVDGAPAAVEPLELFEPGAGGGAGAPVGGDPGMESSLKVRVSSSASQEPEPPAGVETVMSSVPQMMAHKAEEQEEEGLFRQIYQDFIAIKQQCGEPTDNVTFERFSAKLRKNRSNLMDRYSCRDVKFQVYVKDGKAALKATPIKD